MVDVNELQGIDLQFDRSNWLTEELEEALDALPSDHHRTTVLHLAEGRMIGRSDNITFKLPDVCSKKTWHGPYRNGRTYPGWKDDPQVQKALAIAESTLAEHHESAVMANIQEAYRLLADAAVKAVMTLEVLMDTADNDETKRRAANDVLDRVSKVFSRKTTAVTEQRSISFDLSQVPPEMLDQLAGGDVVEGEVIDRS
jgi:hypothetical protein